MMRFESPHVSKFSIHWLGLVTGPQMDPSDYNGDPALISFKAEHMWFGPHQGLIVCRLFHYQCLYNTFGFQESRQEYNENHFYSYQICEFYFLDEGIEWLIPARNKMNHSILSPIPFLQSKRDISFFFLIFFYLFPFKILNSGLWFDKNNRMD